MDIFGIGPLELLFILIIILVFVGPDKLPQMGAKLGRSVKDMRRATREFSREVNAAREAVEAPVNEIKQPLQEVAEPFKELKKTADSATQAAKNIKDPAKALRESVMRELTLEAEPEAPASPAQPEPRIAPPQVEQSATAKASPGEVSDPPAALPAAPAVDSPVETQG